LTTKGVNPITIIIESPSKLDYKDQKKGICDVLEEQPLACARYIPTSKCNDDDNDDNNDNNSNKSNNTSSDVTYKEFACI